MGEIVIEVPTTTKRRYRLSDKTSLKSIIAALDATAVRVKEHPASFEELEYEQDVRDVTAAVAEMRRTGKTYAWEDIKAELGL